MEDLVMSDVFNNEDVDDVKLENDDDDDGVHDEEINIDYDHVEDVDVDINVDIFDLRNWDSLSSDLIKRLVAEGPKRDKSIEKGPKDKNSRRFIAAYYTRVLPNNEKCDREWLVYSKELDKVVCFCCKLLRKGTTKGQLSNEGFSDWKHLSTRLKEHEVGLDHVTNMANWFEMRQRVKKNETIDKVAQEQFEKEKDHWINVIFRIISVVKFLAKHNLAFRGTNEKLYKKSNGNFLGLIEMLQEFDPVIKEHVRRITTDDMHVHYLGHIIQNELILLLAREIKSENIKKVKQAKYFSVILDCTPDTSHQEQMSLILRYVNVSSTCVTIEESFLGFLNVDETTGKRLFDVTLDELKSLDLDIDDVRGQGYDNGSNMKGKHQGVQKGF
ncbi:zinc finger MYM-type protein 1-like protein [Tanacetum coccineum]